MHSGTAAAVVFKIYNGNGGGVAAVAKEVNDKKETMHSIVYPTIQCKFQY